MSGERCNMCHPDDWVESRDPKSPGRLKTVCRKCGKYIGHRPVASSEENKKPANP